MIYIMMIYWQMRSRTLVRQDICEVAAFGGGDADERILTALYRLSSAVCCIYPSAAMIVLLKTE